MTKYKQLQSILMRSPKSWLVTGAAGFIGSNLVETLLILGQKVVGLDNYSTGFPENLMDVQKRVGAERWANFTLLVGDICDSDLARQACEEVDYVLHQAALGSVPRSIANPLATNASNVDGFVSMLWAAKETGVKRFIYASSSSVYGDHPTLPKVEERIGSSLSPYAVSKRANELYAEVFSRCYGIETIGLRYFNVFGPRQDPEGAYAAVIPKWIAAMLLDQPLEINGDGESSRDFCYVANVVQANLLAATVQAPAEGERFINVAVGKRTTLNQLFELIRGRLVIRYPKLADMRPTYRDFRPGDVAHSHADVSKAVRVLGYLPSHQISDGLDEALSWYVDHVRPPAPTKETAASALA